MNPLRHGQTSLSMPPESIHQSIHPNHPSILIIHSPLDYHAAQAPALHVDHFPTRLLDNFFPFRAADYFRHIHYEGYSTVPHDGRS